MAEPGFEFGKSCCITLSFNLFATLPLKEIENEREKKIFRGLVYELDIIKGFLDREIKKIKEKISERACSKENTIGMAEQPLDKESMGVHNDLINHLSRSHG